MTNPSVVVVFGILMLGAFVGCGGDGISAVGTVTVDGQAVSEGEVRFHPTKAGRSGGGVIQPDGTYLISYREMGDGMPPGDYKITISSNKFTPNKKGEEMNEFGIYKSGGKVKFVVPEIYNRVSTTPLTRTLAEDADVGSYDFDISTKE